jgi:hypothetical protein
VIGRTSSLVSVATLGRLRTGFKPRWRREEHVVGAVWPGGEQRRKRVDRRQLRFTEDADGALLLEPERKRGAKRRFVGQERADQVFGGGFFTDFPIAFACIFGCHLIARDPARRTFGRGLTPGEGEPDSAQRRRGDGRVEDRFLAFARAHTSVWFLNAL